MQAAGWLQFSACIPSSEDHGKGQMHSRDHGGTIWQRNVLTKERGHVTFCTPCATGSSWGLADFTATVLSEW